MDDFTESTQGFLKNCVDIQNTPLVAATNPLATPIVLRNTTMKHKRSNVFSLVSEASDMNIKSLIDVMERTKKHHGKVMEQTTKEQLKYLKSIKRKIHHISKNMVNVITSLRFVMCHAFIQNKLTCFHMYISFQIH
jgi:hypothetical protein